MQLGNFSVCLNVKDLKASMAFYEKLGFTSVAGDRGGWAVMQNAGVNVGLFEKHLERTTLCFNPGWDAKKEKLPSFTDVRELEKKVRAAGITPAVTNTADSAAGPAYFIIADPDGNPVMFDQHV